MPSHVLAPALLVTLVACAAPRAAFGPADVRVAPSPGPLAGAPGQPPPPADLVEARERRKPAKKLDLRFVLAFQDVVRFAKGGMETAAATLDGGTWRLSAGGVSVLVADEADFPALTEALVKAAGGPAEEPGAKDAPLLFGAALDAELDAANLEWAGGFRSRDTCARVAHALVSEVVQLDDVFELADALAARAWAFEAIALAKGAGSPRDTAALADALGYSRAARAMAGQLLHGDPIALALRHDDAGLQALAAGEDAAAEARFYFARAAANGADPMAVQRARCGPTTPECAAITHVLLQGKVFEGAALASELVSWFDLHHLEERATAADAGALPAPLFDRATALLPRIAERGAVPFDASVEKLAHEAAIASAAYGRYRFGVKLRSAPAAYGPLHEGIGTGDGALAEVARFLAAAFDPAAKATVTGVGPEVPGTATVGLSMRARFLPATPPTLLPPQPLAAFLQVASRADERPAHRRAVMDASALFSLDPARIEAARRAFRAVVDVPAADANDLAREGRWPELRQLADDSNQPAVARYRAVQELLDHGHLDEDDAAARLRTLVDSSSEDRGMLLDADLFLFRRQRFDEARELLSGWLAAHAEDTSLLANTIRARLVRELTLLGRYPEAEEAARPALAAGKADVLEEVAALKAASGAGAEAMELLEKLRSRYGETAGDVKQKVDLISFTGSAATGRRIAEKAASRLIPVSLELGGKNAALVLEDADLDRASAGIVWGAFANAGQNCAAVSRCYVVKQVAAEFEKRVRARVAKLTAGPDAGELFDVGPVINERQLSRVEKHVSEAKSAGTELWAGGAKPASQGHYFEPTVLVAPAESLAVSREETFGPVLAITVVADEAEALRRANEGEYGLSASVWTRDLRRGERLAQGLDVGTVTVNNTSFTPAIPNAPWSGRRSSGHGATNSHRALAELVQPKFVLLDKTVGGELWWFPHDQSLVEIGRALLGFLNRSLLRKLQALPTILGRMPARQKQLKKPVL